MKANELRDLPQQELEAREKELTTDLFNLKIRHSLNQLNNPLELRSIRRNLARVKTLVAEMRTSAKPAAKG